MYNIFSSGPYVYHCLYNVAILVEIKLSTFYECTRAVRLNMNMQMSVVK